MSERETAPLLPLRILLLEDSVFDVELLTEELKDACPGATLCVVHDREGFTEALAREYFDLILSDHDLPGYTGTEALDHARQVVPHVPFIFVSGVIGEDNAVELLKRGATDFVSKGRLARLPVVLRRALAEVAERAARSNAELMLRMAKEEAEQANRSKDRFLAVLSHELRTPLSAMKYAAFALGKVASVPEQYADLLPMIGRNVDLEARLIDDLLDISAIANGKLSLRPEAIDLRDVLAEVLQTSREQSEKSGVPLRYVRAQEPAWVVGDGARLQQVLSNLVRNAIKFSPPGSEVCLASGVDADGFVYCTCADRGIGIAAGALGRIFAAFEQADEQVARRFGGLGLGLAIARYLAVQHGGTLTAHSEGTDKGATFTLRLPQMKAVDAPGVAPVLQMPVLQPRHRRLLLVEDNLYTAHTLKLCLEDLGWTVEHVETGAAALAAAAGDAFDIVLTDIGLPDGHGVRIVRELSPRMPVVALTGYGAVGDIEQTAAAGVSAHLVKPADPAQIHEVLVKALRSRAQAG